MDAIRATAVHPAAASSVATSTPAPLRRRVSAIAGLTIACALPAMFWPAAVYALSSLVGLEISATTLLVISGSIAAFLAVVCGATMLRD